MPTFDSLDDLFSAADSIKDPAYNPNALPADQSVWQNAGVLKDIRDEYRHQQGEEAASDEEAARWFRRARSMAENNFVLAGVDYADTSRVSGDRQERLARLQQVWDNSPYFWQEGGRGVGEFAEDAITAELANPLNYTPIGAAVNKAVQTTRAGLSVGQAALRGIGAAALTGAAENTIDAAASNAFEQGRDMNLGLQDEFSTGELLASTALGTAGGAVIGGAIGAVPAAIGARYGQSTRPPEGPPVPPYSAPEPTPDPEPLPVYDIFDTRLSKVEAELEQRYEEARDAANETARMVRAQTFFPDDPARQAALDALARDQADAEAALQALTRARTVRGMPTLSLKLQTEIDQFLDPEVPGKRDDARLQSLYQRQRQYQDEMQHLGGMSDDELAEYLELPPDALAVPPVAPAPAPAAPSPAAATTTPASPAAPTPAAPTPATPTEPAPEAPVEAPAEPAAPADPAEPAAVDPAAPPTNQKELIDRLIGIGWEEDVAKQAARTANKTAGKNADARQRAWGELIENAEIEAEVTRLLPPGVLELEDGADVYIAMYEAVKARRSGTAAAPEAPAAEAGPTPEVKAAKIGPDWAPPQGRVTQAISDLIGTHATDARADIARAINKMAESALPDSVKANLSRQAIDTIADKYRRIQSGTAEPGEIRGPRERGGTLGRLNPDEAIVDPLVRDAEGNKAQVTGVAQTGSTYSVPNRATDPNKVGTGATELTGRPQSIVAGSNEHGFTGPTFDRGSTDVAASEAAGRRVQTSATQKADRKLNTERPLELHEAVANKSMRGADGVRIKRGEKVLVLGRNVKRADGSLKFTVSNKHKPYSATEGGRAAAEAVARGKAAGVDLKQAKADAAQPRMYSTRVQAPSSIANEADSLPEGLARQGVGGSNREVLGTAVVPVTRDAVSRQMSENTPADLSGSSATKVQTYEKVLTLGYKTKPTKGKPARPVTAAVGDDVMAVEDSAGNIVGYYRKDDWGIEQAQKKLRELRAAEGRTTPQTVNVKANAAPARPTDPPSKVPVDKPKLVQEAMAVYKTDGDGNKLYARIAEINKMPDVVEATPAATAPADRKPTRAERREANKAAFAASKAASKPAATAPETPTPAAPEAPAATVEVPQIEGEIPEGMVLAVRDKSTGNVRVLSAGQQFQGFNQDITAGVAALRGKSLNAENSEVGFVTEGQKGRAAKAGFQPLGSRVTYTKEELAAQKPQKGNRAQELAYGSRVEYGAARDKLDQALLYGTPEEVRAALWDAAFTLKRAADLRAMYRTGNSYSSRGLKARNAMLEHYGQIKSWSKEVNAEAGDRLASDTTPEELDELARLIRDQEMDSAGAGEPSWNPDHEFVLDEGMSSWDAQVEALPGLTEDQVRQMYALADRTSDLLDVAEDMAARRFVRAGRATEAVTLTEPTKPLKAPTTPDTATEKKVSKGNKAKSEKKAKAEKKAAETKAEEIVATPKGKREKPPKVAAPPAASGSPRQLSDAQVAKALADAHPGSQEYWDLGWEMQRRIQSRPAVKAVAVSWEVRQTPAKLLRMELAKALRDANSKRVDELSKALWDLDNGAPMTEGPKASVVRALRSEIQHTAGQPMADAIPPLAPVTVQGVLERITHRDPVRQATARTLLYRMWNLLNNDLKRELGSDVSLMDIETVYRMAGQTPPEGVAGAFVDLSDPAFGALRRKMRSAAVGLTEGVSSPIDAMHEVGHLAMRSMPDERRAHVLDAYRQALRAGDEKASIAAQRYSSSSEQTKAEEWFVEGFARYLAERVSRDDVFAKRLDGRDFDITTKSRLAQVFSDLLERLRYMVNGLIGRDDMRQMYRQLTFGGDMFQHARGKRGLADSSGDAAIPELADELAAQVQASDSQARRALKRGFVAGGNKGLGANPDGSPITYFHGSPNGGALRSRDFAFEPNLGDRGYGVYVTDSEGVAASYSTEGTYQSLLRAVETSDLSAGRREVALALAEEVANLRRSIGIARREQANLSDIGGTGNDEFDEINAALLRDGGLTGDASRRIEELVSRERQAVEDLESLGVRQDPYVMPLLVRALNTADFRSDTIYGPDDPFVAGVFDGLSDMLTPDSVRSLRQEVATKGTIDGEGLWQRLVLATERDLDLDTSTARGEIGNRLREMGYDSLAASSSRTLDEGDTASFTELVMFDAEAVKHVNAAEFNAESPQVWESKLPTSISGDLALAISQSDGAFNPDRAMGLVRAAEQAGMPAPVVRASLSLIRKKADIPEGLDAFQRVASKLWWRNTDRMRANGAVSIADAIKPVDGTGHFEAMDAMIGKAANPVLRALNKLPGAPGSAKAWAGRVAGRKMASLEEAKVLQALRRPDGSDIYRTLSREGVAAFDATRKLFADLLEQQDRAGLGLGRIKNYIPQVWKAENIQADMEGFERALADYFEAEARSNPERRGFSREQAETSARKMAMALVEDEGVYIPTAARGNRARADHEFQRLIRLDDPKFQANLAALEPYLVNDLRSLVAKYTHDATRRIDLANRFGVNNHGIDDYLSVAAYGKQAAVDMLERGRRTRNSSQVAGALGMEVVTQEHLLMSPIPQAHAQRIVDEGMALVASRGPQEAAKHMLSLHPDAKGNLGPTAAKRMEWLAKAMADFGGEPRKLPPEEIDHIEAFSQRMQGKPLSTEHMSVRRFSQGIRAVNSISLLGWTTLTSLTEPAMILLRSGDMRSFAKGMGNYLSDPHYRQAIKNIGLANDSLIAEAADQMNGTYSGKLMSQFFELTGLTPYTRLTRHLAGAVAAEAIKAETRRLQANYVPGALSQNRAFRQSRGFLKRLGLDELAMDMSGPSIEQRMGDERVQRAMIRFTNEAIFSPNLDDVPSWGQTPWGSIMMQLKRYPLTAGRQLGQYGRDFASWAKGGDGDPWPAVYMLTVLPAAGSAVAALKDIIQSRGEDEDGTPTREVRDRRMTKVMEAFGIKDLEEGDIPLDTFLGWYVEGLMAAGGLGFITDMTYNIAAQADNGAYGFQRTMSSVFGPTVGLASDAFNVMGGVLDMDEDSNDKERTAARSVAGRIPILGGQRGFKEGLVEAWAGEKADKGGDGFASGF